MKRFLLALLLAALCGLALPAAAQQYTIAVIPKGTTHEFWKSIHAGAVKAGREFDAQGVKIDLIWKGPLREDDREQQIQVVENFVARKVSGIVLAPLDAQALVSPVEMAMGRKIPVVIIDSGLNSDRIVSFVATDNFKGGQLGGEYLGKLLGGKGRVMMLRYQEGSASTEQREAGFLDVMKNKFPDIQIVSSDQHSGATRESAFAASQNLMNRFGREIDGVFTPNETSTAGMTLALKDAGKAGGKIKNVGFDAGTSAIEALRAGDVQGLVIQDPFKMGYLGVVTLVKHLKGEKVEPRIDTGVQLITKENIDQPAIKELINPPLDKYLQ